jgi:2-polyprenyl-3-methyl-5-hydroxy-6-metoxy-1,4-benzoquinol methylase
VKETDASVDAVLERNQATYSHIYSNTNPDPIVDRVLRARETLEERFEWSSGALCTWGDGLLDRLQGARVLEVGAGDGETACMMVALGAAHVTTTEIVEDAHEMINQVAAQVGYENQIDCHIGDFLTMDLGPAHSYDVVMLREVLHHIPTKIEDQFIARTAHYLAPGGMTRLKDPAVNSKLLDELRWAVPTPGRPSKVLQPAKFAAWREDDEHPIRDDSTKHYAEIMQRHYGRVDYYVRGTIARLHRLVDSDRYHDAAYRRLSLIDARVPQSVHMLLGNVQRFSCYDPLEP